MLHQLHCNTGISFKSIIVVLKSAVHELLGRCGEVEDFRGFNCIILLGLEPAWFGFDFILESKFINNNEDDDEEEEQDKRFECMI